MRDDKPRLVIFGASNIISDLVDCALANDLIPFKVVVHLAEDTGERSIPLAERVARLAPMCTPPAIEPSPPFGQRRARSIFSGRRRRRALGWPRNCVDASTFAFHTLVHPTAHVSPLATARAGTFVGANSVIAAGAALDEHVFINRGATVGHDTRIGAFSRIQPGSNLGGLSQIGRGVTVGIGATLIERLVVGDNAVIGAGSTVLDDVAENVVVVGTPARFVKYVVEPVFRPGADTI